MPTAMDRKGTNFLVRKCKTLWKITKIFSAAYWSYLLGFLEGNNSPRQHAASQVMVLSSRLRRIQGMIGIHEKAYLYWYGRHIFTGKGDIVDLGSWLGSTTFSLAMGLENNKRSGLGRLIYSYDEFVWRSYMDKKVKGTKLEGKYEPGDSFLEEFEQRASPWHQYVRACPGDLSKVGWRGGPIEFLLIDAMKSWKAATGVVRDFFPSLIPGVSMILHQDFAHGFTSWIHPIHYRFCDYFELVYDVPSSGSLVFRLTRALPLEMLKQEWSPEEFSSEEIDSAFAYSLEIVSREKRANIVAAKAMYFLHTGYLDRARKEICEARSRGYSFDSDLSIVERRVAEETAKLATSIAK